MISAIMFDLVVARESRAPKKSDKRKSGDKVWEWRRGLAQNWDATVWATRGYESFQGQCFSPPLLWWLPYILQLSNNDTFFVTN